MFGLCHLIISFRSKRLCCLHKLRVRSLPKSLKFSIRDKRKEGLFLIMYKFFSNKFNQGLYPSLLFLLGHCWYKYLVKYLLCYPTTLLLWNCWLNQLKLCIHLLVDILFIQLSSLNNREIRTIYILNIVIAIKIKYLII